MLRPGRFDEIIELGLPDEEARQQILTVHLRHKPIADDISVEALAARCIDASGAELAAVCNRAALSALRRVVQSHEGETIPTQLNVKIEQADFDAVIFDMFGDEGLR